MRQRVMIAIALACDPQVLIADEPTTALDVTIQAQILELMKELRDKLGMAVIWITHNLGVVRKMADRVYVMEQGRIVETGTRDTIFDAPKHEYTRKLMEAVPPLYGAKVKTLQHEGSKTTIEVNHVSKDFETKGGLFNRKTGTFRAVNDVLFASQQGDIFGNCWGKRIRENYYGQDDPWAEQTNRRADQDRWPAYQ